MARAAKATKTTKPTITGRKPGNLAAAKAPAKITKSAAAPKRAPAAEAFAPKLSKDELRAQVEKLERATATLRTKNRDAVRAAKTAAARIVELEEQVARLETKVTPQAAPAKSPKPATAVRARRQSRDVDPGDAVPPGVAVQDPAPLDEEAETARENLEEHLGES